MNIGIIGAGNIGANAARLFVNAGHSVSISNSRGGDSLNELVEELGDNAQSSSVEAAIEFGDIVFISIPLGKYQQLPTNGFDGKIVIDSNNYYPDRDGRIVELSAVSEALLQLGKPYTMIRYYFPAGFRDEVQRIASVTLRGR